MKLRLPEMPCCDTDIAVLGAGKGPHAGELRCQNCGRHRRWMPTAALEALQRFHKEVARLFPGGELPVLRSNSIQIGGNEMSFQKQGRQNAGALFKNDRKQGDNPPDYKGTVNFEGAECWIKGWLKTAKNGTKYMSLAVSRKEEE
jgi:hypothetical protein